MQQRTVGILIFPDVEVLDFCGPFEVLSVCRLDQTRRREDPSPFAVILVAATLEPVRASGGLRVLPDHTLESCPPLDLLVVPGGYGTRALMSDGRLIDWIRERALQAEFATSVCTGSLLLGQAGILNGKRATTHWQAFDRLVQAAPSATVVTDEHVVRDGNIATSAGISAGIDMALGIVAQLHGEAVARETARYMEYPIDRDNRRRVDPVSTT